MAYSMLNKVNLTFLNPLIEFLNNWYITIMTVLATAGIIYAVILGINLAKSDNSEKRETAKKRIFNASLTIVITIVLTFTLQFVLNNLDEWVNHSSGNVLQDQTVISNVYYKSEGALGDLVASWSKPATGQAEYTIELPADENISVIIVTVEFTNSFSSGYKVVPKEINGCLVEKVDDNSLNSFKMYVNAASSGSVRMVVQSEVGNTVEGYYILNWSLVK